MYTKISSVTAIALAIGVLCFQGCSDNSTEPTPTPPSAPSDLSATTLSLSSIMLSWIDWSEDEDGFKAGFGSFGLGFLSLSFHFNTLT